VRGRGITYDTGFFHAGHCTREPFLPAHVRRELQIIRNDLHCTAVRITGGDADRLHLAAEHASAAGLEVWYSPFTCDLTTTELLAFLANAAERAEHLRLHGAQVVLVTGSELSLFNQGFLPGEQLEDRLALLGKPELLRAILPDVPARINGFLDQALSLVRARFGGKVTYASLPFDGVDWTPFDIIATDAGYWSAEVADRFRDGIRALVAQNKPAAITEFGCCTYQGAADRGGRGDQIVEWEAGRPVGLNGDYVRDEAEQARYISELLDLFNTEGVDTAFVNTFARYDLPHRETAYSDLDLASYGLVKVFEDRHGTAYPAMPWEPKLAFATLADYYGSR
jgi:hypothetical protein